jgi:hypothetical protein
MRQFVLVMTVLVLTLVGLAWTAPPAQAAHHGWGHVAWHHGWGHRAWYGGPYWGYSYRPYSYSYAVPYYYPVPVYPYYSAYSYPVWPSYSYGYGY